MSSPTPSLTVRNVRLPPAAYRTLSLDTDAAPLVDLEYTASNDTVEVHLTPHHASVEQRFDPDRPFASTIRVDPTPGECHSVVQEAGQRRLVGRFPAPTPAPGSAQPRCIDARGSLGIPGGLCHPHIHLDKCFLLDRCTLSDGTFNEALTATADAKAHFTHDDLVARGRRLIAASLSHGVTSMRAFVEVDPTVGLRCVEAGIALQSEFAGRCNVQLVAFAQDPLFYPDAAKQQHMHQLMRQAASRNEVGVVGSAPYVESSEGGAMQHKTQQRRNIDLVFALAEEHGKHVDFHLDYDLDPPGSAAEGKEAMLPYVLTLSRGRSWDVHGQARRVTVGHCTKLSVYTDFDVAGLGDAVEGVSVVSLPPSDMYMQGREQPYASRSRATLPLLELHKTLRLNWAMGVNNVANLFTPQGDADPLALLPCMVGVWQSAKPHDCETLLAAVSTAARYAAGLNSSYADAEVWADLTLLDGASAVQDAVCAPPFGRTTIANGSLVAQRTIHSTRF
ncbi:zinc metallopeptidase [Moesziomyces aphidis]|uniref:Zinc metallopeptidase n=1 Tax=Moesziomyces aphidis TaxID=84754 RepID=W3VIL8_MOEAP|nr:zinc metallopeptidase [Moesziomyces aphidis]